MAGELINQYRLVAALFLRLLGAIYLFAFLDLGVQIRGLAGAEGIMPVAERLADAHAGLGALAYLHIPTLFWLVSADWALVAACILGALAALLMILDRASLPGRILAFVLYLSLYQAALPFTNFQWDGLLLEAGFLAIFLTPRSRVVILLFRWLLFRLRFMSGLSKLTSGDPTWSGLTALDYYFEVQPLPNPLSWYAHHLPEWLLRAGTAGTLFVELVVPFMIFLPRRWRFAAAWLTLLWQGLILLTSNHNWFNFLTIALCLFLFDDQAVRRVLPERWRQPPPEPAPASGAGGTLRRAGVGALAGLILFASALHLWELVRLQRLPEGLRTVLDYAEAYRVCNSYHVFPVMNTERIELQLSGSIDGEEWRPYVFKYKPGDPARRPQLVIPHQPRLDWQMWFVVLGPGQLNWFHAFLESLLDNSPAVIDLLANDPFPDEAPRYVRVEAYRYRFTTPEEHARTGDWWKREDLGPFRPLPWVTRW